MRKIIILLSLIFFASGCATVKQDTRISSSLKAQEYNSVASTYMVRPTFISLQEMSDGTTVLAVEMKQYDHGLGGLENMNMWGCRFSKNNISDYTALIDKFLSWENIANERDDAFTKEIGRARAWSNGPSGDLKFTFHSGGSGQHFLALSFCAAGTCLDEKALFFRKDDAVELKALLNRMRSGQLQQSDIDAVYN